MNKKTRMFFSAFAITCILIGALCGFVAVDLSTDRYMPDKFGPFFEIVSIEPDGVNFSFQAEDYRLDTTPVAGILSILSNYRGLFPAAPRVGAALAERGTRYALGLRRD